MRKRLKLKLRSCKLCKPQKMHRACRWKPKELAALKESERTIEEWKRKTFYKACAEGTKFYGVIEDKEGGE